MATTETMFPDQSDFNYDYDTLRTTGVILAAIMSITGIVIALSKKCTKCVNSSSNSSTSQIPKADSKSTSCSSVVTFLSSRLNLLVFFFPSTSNCIENTEYAGIWKVASGVTLAALPGLSTAGGPSLFPPVLYFPSLG
uniref:FXYD domain-containing ion transport regulator n=1 Tax=Takifugu rubripes TaxID=31033 RepID=A0A3B5KJ53_TAKRU